MELSGKTAVVIGGGRGPGKEIARSLSEKGAVVKILARSLPELELASKEFPAIPIKCDITKEEDVKTALVEIGKIDVLVNNAGIWAKTGAFENSDNSDTRRMFEVNFFSLARTLKLALPGMKERNSGTIVNVLSTSALDGKPNQAPYVASKFTAKGLSDAVRRELSGTGVKIICVYLGGVKAGIFSKEDRNPSSYGYFMDPKDVAEKIVANIEK